MGFFVTQVYTGSIGKLYERDMRQFFDEARTKIMGLRDKKCKTRPENL